jgi:hypothetical protein
MDGIRYLLNPETSACLLRKAGAYVVTWVPVLVIWSMFLGWLTRRVGVKASFVTERKSSRRVTSQFPGGRFKSVYSTMAASLAGLIVGWGMLLVPIVFLKDAFPGTPQKGLLEWWQFFEVRFNMHQLAPVAALIAIGLPMMLSAGILARFLELRAMRVRLEGRCARCGYLLRGLATRRCPECGEPF